MDPSAVSAIKPLLDYGVVGALLVLSIGVNVWLVRDRMKLQNARVADARGVAEGSVTRYEALVEKVDHQLDVVGRALEGIEHGLASRR